MTWILPRQLHTLACALDTEALSLDSNEQSQVCAQSVFVRSKPSQSRIWSAKWKRDSWTRHLSGRILRPSLGNRFATEWTSSLGGIRVSPSVQQGSAEARTTRGTCGPTSQTAFDFSDLGAASLRTSKDISAWGCPTSSKTWQEWVIEQRGAYSQRLNAERHTSANGCSSWPSPVASEVRQGFQDRSRGMKGSQESLTTVVIKGWPTPNAADSFQGGATQGNRKDPNLSIAVHGQAVPASSSTLGSRPESWATPSNSMTAGRSEQMNCRAGREGYGHVGNHLLRQTGNNGKLNPRWVETLMGLPVGWTMPSCASPVTIERMSSDSSVTVLSQQQQNEPSEA
jgi:hypothetical protein